MTHRSESKVRIVSMDLYIPVKFGINSESDIEPLNSLKQKCWGWLERKQDTGRGIITEFFASVQIRNNKGMREGRRQMTIVPWQKKKIVKFFSIFEQNLLAMCNITGGFNYGVLSRKDSKWATMIKINGKFCPIFAS